MFMKTAIRLLAIVALAACVTGPAAAAGSDSSLRGTVLVADSALARSAFAQSVIVIVRNNDLGSLGVAVNRPAGTSLAHVLLKQLPHAEDYDLFAGGPVGAHQLSLLVEGDGDRAGFDGLAPGVAFSAQAKAFDRVIEHALDPHKVRVFIGYAGWAPGQLESEIDRGEWHIVPADKQVIFADHPERLWQRLIERFGGDRGAPEKSL